MPKGRYSKQHLRRTKVFSHKGKNMRENRKKDEKRMAITQKILNDSVLIK